MLQENDSASGLILSTLQVRSIVAPSSTKSSSPSTETSLSPGSTKRIFKKKTRVSMLFHAEFIDIYSRAERVERYMSDL